MVAGDPQKDFAVPVTDSLRQKSRQVRRATVAVKSKRSKSILSKPSKIAPAKNLFCRYELKYRIDESKARAIEQFIKPYIHMDRYSKLRSDSGGAYPIVSLYLDSQDFRFCRESMTGKKNRVKLRIRSYDDDTSTPYFFEIKRRLNNVIIKSRARVNYNDMAALMAARSVGPQKYKADEQTLRQFQLYMNYINARPAILIRYMRKAYEDDSDNRVRVTFDRLLRHNVTSEPVVRFGGMGWQQHKQRGVVLELKFTARYPAWLSGMVKCFNLRQESMSKYASSVQHACLMGFCAPQVSV
ncbi:MAG: VTC domain-containing protein [Planctomycetota bacterium]|jgi:hypothetical protein